VFLLLLVFSIILVSAPIAFANVPNAGGDSTVVNPVGEGAVSINEDTPQPESDNIRLIVPTLTDPGGLTPSSIRIISVTGGTLWQGTSGTAITLGASGTILSLSSGRINFRFAPDSNRDTNASFQYVVVDPHNSSVNSAESAATIPITPVNDPPVLSTSSGDNGDGLYATYYLNAWDLTGSSTNRVDTTVNFASTIEFSNPTTVWGMAGMNSDQFSIRWIGKVKAPVTGTYYFRTYTDDGVRLWVNGSLIIDKWVLQGPTNWTSAGVSLTAGTKYDIRMEFYERGGGETAGLLWSYPNQGYQTIPQANLFPGTSRAALSYVNSSGAVPIDDGVAIADIDSVNMSGASVSISTNYISGEDFLGFNNQNGITGSYNSTTGILTLNGSATLANYQTALQSVTYTNTNATPNASTRTVTFAVNDGSDNSNSTTRNIGITATNNPPVIAQGASTIVTMDEDASPTAFSLTLGASDTENNTMTWSISGSAGHGSANVSGTGNSKVINYTPAANYNGSDSFLVQVSDGIGGTDTITVNVTIDAQNDPPAIAEGASLSKTIDEDSSPMAFTQTLTAADIDGDTLAWSISTPAAHGSVALSGSGDTRSLTYEPAANYNGSDSFVVTVDDENGGTDTIAINTDINPRNDPPQMTAAPKISQPVPLTRVDHTLGVSSGTWIDTIDLIPGSLSFSYQWQRCETADCTNPTNIIGAMHTTYTVKQDDQNKFLRAKVTATDNGEGSPVTQSVIVYTTAIGQILAADSNLIIEQNKQYTNSPVVGLGVLVQNILTGVTEMSFSEDPLFTAAVWVPFSLSARYTLSSGDGQKTVYVRFRDVSGNESAIYSNTIVLDTVANLSVEKVDKKIFKPTLNRLTTESTKPMFSGTAEPGSMITINIHSDPVTAVVTTDASGNWNWTPPLALAYGTHSAKITSVDPAGNSSEVSFSLIIEKAYAINSTANGNVSDSTNSATSDVNAVSSTESETQISKIDDSSTQINQKHFAYWPWLILIVLTISSYLIFRKKYQK